MPREEKSVKGIGFYCIMALLSAAAPFCLALAWPPYDFPYLIWIGFAPLYFVLKRTSWLVSILLVFLSGIVYYLLLLDWVATFHRTFALPFITVASTLGSWLPALLLSKPVIEKKPLAGFLIIPAIWVLFEYLKIQGFLGFAFGIVGYGLYEMKELIQFSEATGIWGASFLICAVSYLVFYLTDRIVIEKKSVKKPAIFIPAMVVIITVVGLMIFGAARMNGKPVYSQFEVGLIQTDIPEELKWNVDQGLIWAEIDNLLSLTVQFKPAILFLPENTVKTPISMNPYVKGGGIEEIVAKLSNMAITQKSYILLGSGELTVSNSTLLEHNSACLFSPDGRFIDAYRKNRLVPFGEYFPYGDTLPFVEEILKETGTHMFIPGGDEKKTLAFTYSNMSYPFGALICFEGTFGYLSAGMVQNGARFLVNITCDSWAGSDTAMEQHAVFGVFRAIENRVSFIRVGNGGKTCLIDPWGRVLNSLDLNTSSAAVTRIVFYPGAEPTMYNLYGDWFVLLALIGIGGWGIFIGIRLVIKKGREKPAPKD
ncbi:MAG: apolipoprotein N-acyltransferase [Spirochaetes bacterium GWF1_51_8]|nr:MAG: apolipoprotein N-acyltransferase [Spirochaetes bacterium GWF1_51_8]